MKTTIKLLALFALLLAALNPQAAGAATTGYRYRGKSAQLNYSSLDESGCVYTDVWVFASKEMVHQPPGPGSTFSQALVSISQYNNCTDTRFYVYGSAPLSDTDFQIDQKLESATLTAIVPVSNQETGLAFDAQIHLTFTSRSPLGYQDYHKLIRYDGFHWNQNAKGEFRYARLSGTVTDGTTNYTPDLSTAWGFLYNAREGTVSHGPQP